MSSWHDELEFALFHLDDAKTNCDGITYVISKLLTDRYIYHQCRIGLVEDRLTRQKVSPHCWVELEGGWCIDLRLRRWLGDEDDIPHGVFQAFQYSRVRYFGAPLCPPILDEDDLVAFSDGTHWRVQIPESMRPAADW